MAVRLTGSRIPAGGVVVALPSGRADDPLRVVPEARQKAERTPLFSGLLTGPGGGRRDHALVCWQTAFTRVATGTSACLRDGRHRRLMVRAG
jgi:hypothetical protein